MALSNWATYAVDHNGDPVPGVFKSPEGWEAEFYKNKLFIRPPDADDQYDTIARIKHDARLKIGDMNIIAEKRRKDQNGLFAIIWTGYEHKDNIKAMLGAAVYGYDAGEWVGVKHGTKAMLGALHAGWKDGPTPKAPNIDYDPEGEHDFNQGDKYLIEQWNDIDADEAADEAADRDKSIIEEAYDDKGDDE